MATVSFGRPSLDRISDLPSNVIDNILVLLPISEAVRTSTLSKKWKEKWRTLPRVIVDEDLLPQRYYRWSDCIINCILLKHEGRLEKFYVSTEVRDFNNVNTWLWRLEQKGIRELFLLYRRGHYNKVPSSLFSCQQLIKLSLRRCSVEPPRFSRGFPNLTSLELDKVIMKTCAFEKLISSCPLLERLTLRKLSCQDHLQINVPKLKYLCFEGAFISMCLDTPFLEVLSINLHRNIHRFSDPDDHNPFDFRFKFCVLPSAIKELYVRCQFQKYLAACDRFTEVVTYSHLRTLQLDEFCFEKLEQVRCLLCLIGGSVNLATLDVTACGCESEGVGNSGAVTKFWEEKNKAPSSLKQLKKVRVRSFRGKDPEMKLIQHIMENAPALEEMTVECKENSVFDGHVEVNRVLRRLCKASTQLKFIQGNHHESNAGSDGGSSDSGPDSCGSYTQDSD
ncbi:F-box family protein [Euphorbia peplus]|nr:F-box family protein [Euphorbia peplus]